ncbi:MAG: tryptophan synthase subunit alpha [Firmicutes bacterium]|nr:tryptophan synthase subunit alpha [Bacillota bacterium]
MRISAAFNRINESGKTGVIPYIMAGDPDLETTARAVQELAAAGADLIELGVPFSDPVADGPVIQQAGQRALKSGTTLEGILEMVSRLREQGFETPLLLMSYYNPIYNRGLAEAASRFAAAGVDGLIIPDLPPEEGGELESELKKHGIDLVYLLAPTSSDERIKEVASRASGFIYCVSLTGVTGARGELPVELPLFLGRVRKATSLPLAVGFGISTSRQVREVGRVADAAIIGSALIDESGPRTDVFREIISG